ncbi:hypothetical protein [Clavibacter sp.]|uniref:hypothetical protein n=1 Tax=Clavibacter sp. TaxID=1871044 RepID=UPI0019BB13CB|nr:hypothetical protein [Clavibacter sp.]MBD5381974.1 hypothetical protein [Clavibacter sp.]
MTAKEKKQILDRLQRANQLERTLEKATDVLTLIHHPQIEREMGTQKVAEAVWSAIREMPQEYVDAICVIVKKWGEDVNEEYKKL